MERRVRAAPGDAAAAASPPGAAGPSASGRRPKKSLSPAYPRNEPEEEGDEAPQRPDRHYPKEMSSLLSATMRVWYFTSGARGCFLFAA